MKELRCVLLIDDNENDNYFHTYIINKVNPSLLVKSVLSGEEAIKYFEMTETDPENYPFPELVFLDINMPGMNGFEFLEKTRTEDIFKGAEPIVVIMLTSSLNHADTKRAETDFKREIIEFQNKPLTAEMFNEVVEKHFNG